MQVMAGAERGGAERFFVALTAALARAGVTQHAVLRDQPDRLAALDAAGVPCDTLPFGGPFDWRSGPALGRRIKAFRPDIVLSWMSRAASRVPRGRHAHLGRLGGYYDLKYFAGCDLLVCNDPSVVDHCRRQGWPEGRLRLIRNFADLRPVAAGRQEAPPRPAAAPLVLALGRLHPNKAFDILLKALAIETRPRLWLAGEGDERAELESMAARLGVTDRVHFLGWRQDVAALFAAADICVVPSRQEPFGNVVVEAWGHGTPLVAAASAGPANAVRPDEDALLVPVDDPQALAAAIARLIDEPGLAARLAEAGHARYAAEFTEAVCVEQYMRLFDEMAGPAAGRRAG